MLTVGVGIALLALVGGLLVLLRRPGRPPSPDDRDQDVLDEAEREVQDLPSGTSPDDADEQLGDWGPGAPP
jgi:hypothetical protein